MKIAFDLDDTLIPTTTDFKCGSKVLPFPLSLLFKEELRIGASDLLNHISKKHDVFIYTSSLRNPLYIKAWFWCWGVKIKDVINHRKHYSLINGTHYSRYSKAPGLFNIDVLVDDLPGIAMECEQQGCRAIIVSPKEADWEVSIKTALDTL